MSRIYKNKECVNCVGCVSCHSCLDCSNCNDCKNCDNCENCVDCEDCVDCVGLTGAAYMVDNVQLTEEEFWSNPKNLKAMDLTDQVGNKMATGQNTLKRQTQQQNQIQNQTVIVNTSGASSVFWGLVLFFIALPLGSCVVCVGVGSGNSAATLIPIIGVLLVFGIAYYNSQK